MKKNAKLPGLAPGTLIHVGAHTDEPVRMTLTGYSAARLEETEIERPETLSSVRGRESVTWINVDGVHQVGLVEEIGRQFDIHPLTLEDVVNTSQRPKTDDYEDYLFVVLKMLYYDPESETVLSEQVSLVLGDDFLISFQEVRGDVFQAVRDRLRKSKGRIRASGPDYLMYALMDAVVDHYFVLMDLISEKIAALEDDLLDETGPDAGPDILHQIHDMKREITALKRQIAPVRDILIMLMKGESPLIKDSTGIFLNDVADHVTQVTDGIESLRDHLSGLQDLYLSLVSNRMNEIMKVLTIMAALFIPLTFIAGIYGMNFEYIPELKWRWGYFTIWGVMVVMAVCMLVYFRKKRWL